MPERVIGSPLAIATPLVSIEFARTIATAEPRQRLTVRKRVNA
jgi:hypothetical protein